MLLGWLIIFIVIVVSDWFCSLLVWVLLWCLGWRFDIVVCLGRWVFDCDLNVIVLSWFDWFYLVAGIWLYLWWLFDIWICFALCWIICLVNSVVCVFVRCLDDLLFLSCVYGCWLDCCWVDCFVSCLFGLIVNDWVFDYRLEFGCA